MYAHSICVVCLEKAYERRAQIMQTFIIQRLIAILAEKNISERQLSSMVDRSDSYINKILNGQIPFTLEILDRICMVLDIEPQEFFTMPNVETPEEYMLLKEWRSLTKDDKEYLLDTVNYIKKKNKQSNSTKIGY